MECVDGLIGREEDDGTKRDLFGAAGSDPSPMESQDTRDIVLQVRLDLSSELRNTNFG